MDKFDKPTLDLSPNELQEIKDLLKSQKNQNTGLLKPTSPGEVINESLAVKKIDHKCSSNTCLSQLEYLYVKRLSNPGLLGSQEYHWEYKCTRCSRCGLMYELDGLS